MGKRKGHVLGKIFTGGKIIPIILKQEYNHKLFTLFNGKYVFSLLWLTTNHIFFSLFRGIFGLWLDEDLYRGRSHSCETFANDTLSSSEDFICCGLEAWGFV